MFDPAQMEVLQFQLEQARKDLLVGDLNEHHAWTLVDRASELLEEATGTEYEETLEVIYTLLQSLWEATAAKAKLNAAWEDLKGE